MTNPILEAKEDFNQRANSEGWWRNTYTTMGVCPVITISEKFGEHGPAEPIIYILSCAAMALFGERRSPRYGTALAAINDHPNTTRDDLDRVFDFAADIWERGYAS